MQRCNILDTFLKFHKLRIDNYGTIISLAHKCCCIANEENKKLPFHINVISAAARGKLKETAHSRILHDLLHHSYIFNSFISNILHLCVTEFKDVKIDYPDRNRIDLGFHTKDWFIIIENKVNGADEQEGQIYRYNQIAKQTHNDSNIIILYLNPSGYTPPSLFSRSKDGKGQENDKDTIPESKIVVKDYRHDILSWLKILEEDIPKIEKEEVFLTSAIRQYIDYLEERFHINSRYIKINQKMDNEIAKIIGLNDEISIEERIDILSAKIEEVELLKSQMEREKQELTKQLWDQVLTKGAEEMNAQFKGAIHFMMFDHKTPEMGFKLKCGDEYVHTSVIFYTNGTPYWRIYGNNKLSDETVSIIKEIIEHDFKDVYYGKSEGWDFYKETSIENWQLRLTQLARLFMSSDNLSLL